MNIFKNKKARRQFVRFAMVGLSSTALDITLFNLAVIFLHLPLLAANVLSATLATFYNYFAHARWTFKTEEDEERQHHLGAYILVTASSLYIVQNVVLYGVKNYWKLPSHLAVALLQHLNLVGASSDNLVLNIAKLYAILVGGLWSFIFYRKFVFINTKKLPTKE
jgi:putative flippase GtrA